MFVQGWIAPKREQVFFFFFFLEFLLLSPPPPPPSPLLSLSTPSSLLRPPPSSPKTVSSPISSLHFLFFSSSFSLQKGSQVQPVPKSVMADKAAPAATVTVTAAGSPTPPLSSQLRYLSYGCQCLWKPILFSTLTWLPSQKSKISIFISRGELFNGVCQWSSQ